MKAERDPSTASERPSDDQAPLRMTSDKEDDDV
jgi:hypothetical protein